MSNREKWITRFLLVVGLYAALQASGIVPAIIPANVPTANKIGNSAKFQTGASGGVAGDCLSYDVGLNVTGPGTGAGCGVGGATGGGLTVYSGVAGIALSGTVFFPFGGGALASATETAVQVTIQSSADISKLGVRLSVALGGGNSVVFTVRQNAADTTVTCTIADPAVDCGDTTHSFSAVAGDELTVKAVFTGTIVATPNFMIAAQVGTLATGTVTTGTQGRIAYYSGNNSVLANSGASTNHGVWLAQGTSAPASTAAGTTGQCFMGVTSADPAFTSCSIGVITYKASNWSSTGAAWTTFSMDTIDADSSGGTIWAIGTPTRYVATSAGRWTIRVTFGTAAASNGAETGIRFQLNGASTDAAAYIGNIYGVSGGASQFGSAYYEAVRTFNLAANDFIEAYYFVSSGQTEVGGKQNTSITFFKEMW